MNRILWPVACLGLLAPFALQAQDAYVAADISLQTGPDTDYPPVMDLAAGTPVAVQGCIDGFTWCDVIAGDNRGWVAGTYLEESYNNQFVIVSDFGPRIGVPVVTFSLDAYWGAHYRDRSWYGQRDTWVARNIHPRTPPRLTAAPFHPAQGKGPAAAPRGGPAHETPATGRTPANAAVQQHEAKPVVDARPAATPHEAVAPKPRPEATVAQKPKVEPKPEPKAAPKVEPKAKPPAPAKDDEHKDDHKDDGKEHR
jgi:uncharacterized protein YraI